jgi:hypothetical protein
MCASHLQDQIMSYVMFMRLTSVGNVGGSHHSPDLLHALKVWAQATVHGEDLFVDDGGDGQAVEAVCKGLPELNVVSPLACQTGKRLDKAERQGRVRTHTRHRSRRCG